ncbi:PAS domain S-box protein [Desulfitobacterium sp.]|uniref:PAS domain S-box protein n=1 Tax=Desulfitobacterium sp. TaxID=49981 RepID=UPI002B9A9162|nr:PAS domain S-box protein [Desulfitobacterium sp.]HVJ49020.1 PAS domain S-box protein [Desulfitobacterium sp.]
MYKAEKLQVNILLVDDRPENLLALEAVLTSPEYQVIKANSGEEALKWVLKEQFAVILLDVQMPGLDGFETARLIKRRKKSKDVPVIFITALSQASEHVEKGYASGGIDYIFKPFEPSTLLKKVEGFVKIYQAQARVKIQSQLLQQRAAELEDLNLELECTTSALRKAEALARAITDVSIDTVLVFDPEGCIINVNSAILAMFGYLAEELVGKDASQLLPELVQLLKERNPRPFCTLGLAKDGKPFPVEISIGEAIVDDQHVTVCSIRDITDRQENEKTRNEQYELLEKLVLERTLEISATNEKLQISEQLFRKTFEFSPNLMAIRSVKDGRYLDVNESWEKLTGYRLEELKDSAAEIINLSGISAEANSITQFSQEESLQNIRVTYETKSGTLREGLLSTEILKLKGEQCLLSVVTDVTENLRLEKEIARLDRLDLIGEMAAGIAHEIRNPMTTVRGFLQMMKARPQHQENLEYFELMMSELDRANSIITEYLTLSKDQALDLKMDNLNVLLETLFPLIQADAFNRKNDVQMELDEIPYLMLDQREIRQMILNLARDGLEAMPHGGILSLRTIRAVEEVVFEVQDQGPGIDSEILNKLGNPFFTTKENGTGLGLAVCFRIAEKHKARISIKTSSSGTTFAVHFPKY